MDFLVSIVILVVILALIGFLVYVITENVPMPPVFKQVISAGVAILLVLYVLGIILGRVPMPTLPMWGKG